MLNNLDTIRAKLVSDMYVRFIIFLFGLILITIQKLLSLPVNFEFAYIILLIILATNAIVYYSIKKNKIDFLTEYYLSLVDFGLISYSIWSTGGLNSLFWFIFVFTILIEGLSLNRPHLVFNLVLSLVTYPVLLNIFHYEGFTPAQLNLIASRLINLSLVGLISLSYIDKVIKQRQIAEKLNADNIVLNSKLEEFSQTLLNEVNTATTDLKEKIHEIELLYKKFRNLFMDFAHALSAAVDARDPYTHGHSERVTKIVFAIVEEMQQDYGRLELTTEVKETLLISALLHDIGKLSLPDEILQKPAPLTDKEWVEMKKHPVIGQNILKPIEDLKAAGTIIRAHHERLDGKGYPDNLGGEDIPFLARIICVADSFDAMTSDRPYRPRMQTEAAVAEIQRCEGSQFDSTVVKAFLAAYKHGTLYVVD